MVSSTVPAETIDSHVEDHTVTTAAATTTAPTSSEQSAPAPAAAVAEKNIPSAPAVNPWKLPRKDAVKPVSNPEAEAEKRVESIIENIKEVTLGKCFPFVILLFFIIIDVCFLLPKLRINWTPWRTGDA
jgi:la-related protein 1